MQSLWLCLNLTQVNDNMGNHTMTLLFKQHHQNLTHSKNHKCIGLTERGRNVHWPSQVLPSSKSV